MSENMELKLDDLEAVSGGYQAVQMSNVKEAYCRQCGRKLTKDGDIRIGGITGVYHCTNVECTEYNKRKYNDEVLFK